jgi:hypothetical protein
LPDQLYISLYCAHEQLAGQIDVGYLSAKSIFGQRRYHNDGLICVALISSLSSLIMVGPG